MSKTQKIWLLDHPVSQYKEDVVSIAKANNLKIVDSKLRSMVKAKNLADSTPKVTKKSESAQAKEAAAQKAAALEPSEN